MQESLVPRYSSRQARLRALVERDLRARDAFVYAVVTTGVVCKPGCGSRAPRPENVVFFRDVAAAERAGFRRCKRCFRPDRARTLERACRLLAAEADGARTTTAAVAATLETDASQLVRTFRAAFGVTPQQYRRRVISERARGALSSSKSVTEALYAAGYGAPSRFYAGAGRELGMKPRAALAGGRGEGVSWALLDTELGRACAAWTERGVTALFFVKNAAEAERELERALPSAVRARAPLPKWLGQIVRALDAPREHDIPLDLQGTAFQARVWRALSRIPAGETRSYSEIARAVGRAGAVRAVARAIAENPIAVLVPCHRVVGKDGSLTGYRWGLEKKRELLRREARASKPRRR